MTAPLGQKPVRKRTNNRNGNTRGRQSICHQMETHRHILNSVYNGTMVTDVDGYVTHFNKPYGEFLGVDYGAQIGKHCTEVV